MSEMSYNGVTLPYVDTNDFRQEVVRDDEGDTDWILTKFDISVQAVIHGNYLSLLAPDLASSVQNPADIMTVVRTRLMAQRKALSFKVGGVELIPQPTQGNPGTVDSRNGPRPESCSIIEITNGIFLISYHIVAHYWENNKINTSGSPIATNLPGNMVLFNRWSETVDIDNCNYSRKTRQGKFMIRSDNREGRIADEARRQMAQVGLNYHFLREAASYTVSADGLSLQYRITDREVFRMPPPPAFEADGYYMEMAPHRGGTIRYGEVRVTLKGQNSLADQPNLILAAIRVGANKLIANGARFDAKVDTTTGVPETAFVRMGLYDNVVEFYMRAMLPVKKGTNPKGRIATIPFTGINTVLPGSDDRTDYVPQYFGRGTAGLLLEAARYYDPSLADVKLTDSTREGINYTIPNTTLNSQLNKGADIGTAGATRE